MSPLNITQPLGIWSIMDTYMDTKKWCPIFPKWDSYQPLLNGSKKTQPQFLVMIYPNKISVLMFTSMKNTNDTNVY